MDPYTPGPNARPKFQPTPQAMNRTGAVPQPPNTHLGPVPEAPTDEDKPTPEPQPTPSKAPNKKVVAATAGALGGGEIARLITFFIPALPSDVALTIAILIIGAVSFAAAYFTPPETNP